MGKRLGKGGAKSVAEMVAEAGDMKTEGGKGYTGVSETVAGSEG